MLTRILIALIVCFAAGLCSAQRIPNLADLQVVSQLPSELPQRVTGIAFDGEKLWFSIYLSRGQYATFDPQIREWKVSDDETHHQKISELGQPFSTVSGMTFIGRSLWLGGSYGQSFGSISRDTWEIERKFSGRLRPDKSNSQGFASLAYDGTDLWAAWHMHEYKRPVSETQQLLKIDQQTGKVIDRFGLPGENRGDGVHGLTYDGQTLWHVKGRMLSAIDLNGQFLAQHRLTNCVRPSGLAWDGQYLWIVEFSGKLWKMPLY